MINNAGIGIAGAVEDTATEEAYEQFDTNFRRAQGMPQRYPIENRGMGIINISSVAGSISIM